MRAIVMTAALLALPAVWCWADEDDPEPNVGVSLARLKGTWQADRTIVAGKERPTKTSSYTFDGEKGTQTRNLKGEVSTREFTAKIDPKRRDRLELTFDSGVPTSKF